MPPKRRNWIAGMGNFKPSVKALPSEVHPGKICMIIELIQEL
jgi:hypothetical protein